MPNEPEPWSRMPDVRDGRVPRLIVEGPDGFGRLSIAVRDAEQCWLYAARLAPLLASRDAVWYVEQP